MTTTASGTAMVGTSVGGGAGTEPGATTGVSGGRGSYADLPLAEADPVVASLISQELTRLRRNIELIASENFTPVAVLEAVGSVLTNKYSEGYPAARYYGGCEVVDEVENLAIERAKALFGAEHVNVQPHSGSNANAAVYYAAILHGDRVLSMRLDHGGHLTHGLKVNFSGRRYEFYHYGLDVATGLLDYDAIRTLAKQCHPKLIVAGASAYPRTIDFTAFRSIADEVGADLMVDMAHIAGLVAAGLHPSPFGHAQWISTTTHKTLAGPRGGTVFCDADKASLVDRAIFPGTQGGPLQHVIAGKAVCFHLAATEEFREKQRQTLKNAQVLAGVLTEGGVRLVSGGTENHLMLVDLSESHLTGLEAEQLLDRVGITANKNAIPADPRPPKVTSGLRLGTPAVTTRGFGVEEMREVGEVIVEVLTTPEVTEARIEKLRARTRRLTDSFVLYPTLSV